MPLFLGGGRSNVQELEVKGMVASQLTTGQKERNEGHRAGMECDSKHQALGVLKKRVPEKRRVFSGETRYMLTIR